MAAFLHAHAGAHPALMAHVALALLGEDETAGAQGDGGRSSGDDLGRGLHENVSFKGC